MPYGIVSEEIRSGELIARRIERPDVKLTLFLAHASHKGLADERLFHAFIYNMVERLAAAIGPYAHPIDRVIED
jgi:LysR family nitrogen assimilation transcriptional regulator